jgi:hypothetical protein
MEKQVKVQQKEQTAQKTKVSLNGIQLPKKDELLEQRVTCQRRS